MIIWTGKEAECTGMFEWNRALPCLCPASFSSAFFCSLAKAIRMECNLEFDWDSAREFEYIWTRERTSDSWEPHIYTHQNISKPNVYHGWGRGQEIKVNGRKIKRHVQKSVSEREKWRIFTTSTAKSTTGIRWSSEQDHYSLDNLTFPNCWSLSETFFLFVGKKISVWGSFVIAATWTEPAKPLRNVTLLSSSKKKSLRHFWPIYTCLVSPNCREYCMWCDAKGIKK